MGGGSSASFDVGASLPGSGRCSRTAGQRKIKHQQGDTGHESQIYSYRARSGHGVCTGRRTVQFRIRWLAYRDRRVQQSGKVVNHAVPAALAAKINSGNWGQVSTQQLASAGIRPGMSAAGTGITAVVKPAPQTRPLSASGCNYFSADIMCIYVTGKGLHVDDWDTSVANILGLYKCSYAGYWVAGVLTATSNVVCGNGDFWAYYTPLRYYINGTKLCNTWLNWNGKPCETVHS